MNKYMCNYCFVAECHDIKPDSKNTKCKGLPELEANSGGACEIWGKKIK